MRVLENYRGATLLSFILFSTILLHSPGNEEEFDGDREKATGSDRKSGQSE